MVNVKLGDKTYTGVTAVKTDTTDGGTAEFAPYDETFAAGKAEGVEEGYANGKTDGIAEGIKSEYDRFWDAYQKNGQLKYYAYSFVRWPEEVFRPKYSIAPTGPADNMFWECNIGDLAGILKEQNVTLDTSGATSVNFLFAGSGLTHIPEVSFLSVGNGALAVFNYNVHLVEIEKVILRDDGAITFEAWFELCNKLTTITFEGVIGQDINFQWSPLSATSINSVITHLSDTATGKTATFMRSAVNAAFETAAGAADGATSQVWLDLIATKPNWTISLA
jgi:hypothetical protein